MKSGTKKKIKNKINMYTDNQKPFQHMWLCECFCVHLASEHFFFFTVLSWVLFTAVLAIVLGISEMDVKATLVFVFPTTFACA